jgi:osmoprotectant transport system ATP-binding protein
MIRFENVTKRFVPGGAPIVDDLTLTVEEGEICMLVGPSGCGKTTTMKMVNKLTAPTSGAVYVGDRNVEGVKTIALRLSIGYVIQDIGLFPHLTVAANIATVPIELGWARARIDARLDELLTLVDLDPAIYRRKKPRELSGGQKQRVGIARALAGDPPIMLMDEPFGALDPITRTKMQDEFLHIQKRIRKTIVFVTHDIQEAMRMGDRLAILRTGKLVQSGSPREILLRPADAFVSELTGSHKTLRMLSLISCWELMREAAGPELHNAAEGVIPAQATAEDPLSEMLLTGATRLRVEDADHVVCGIVSLDDPFANVRQERDVLKN